MSIKKETKRIVVTVELEIDEDGVDFLTNDCGSDMVVYLGSSVNGDITVRNVLKIEEFKE
ncbi:MAG: hypothetical protein PHE67_02545 [Campylobacterales bacterium]|nr:hypothetical protein [Campylobacterales bacterium]